MQNFIAQSMRRFGLAPKNKSETSQVTPSRISISSEPLAHMKVGSKWSYSTLEYPMDIQSRTDLGHYIMFYVNVPNNTQYSQINTMKKKTGKEIGTAGLNKKRSLEEKQVLGLVTESKEAKSGGFDTNGQSWMPGTPEKVVQRAPNQGQVHGQVGGEARTKRTTDSIVLYMPPQLTTNYASAWKENEIGGAVMESAGRIANIINRAEAIGYTDAVGEAVPAFAGQVKRIIEKAAAKTISGIVGGDAMGAFDKISNRAMNNFLEATFTGIGFRKFSYNWKFAPKNVDEVFEVEKIIKTFKFHMLPELPDDEKLGRYYTVPSEFDIFYMFRGDENAWLNKIQTCVLVNMEINYSPNQYQTFRPVQGKSGAPPTEIDMKLDFMETKVITKAEVLQGY